MYYTIWARYIIASKQEDTKMANKALFNTKSTKTKGGLAKNEAGGDAYQLEDRATLAQLAATGCLSGTFYASAQDQLDAVKTLADRISRSGGNEFIAKLAVYARRSAFMKDMPALLLSILAVRAPDLYEEVFPLVADNGKMVRNHVQIVRSGQIDGRKSMPRAMRRQLKMWFARRKNDRLFKDSVGNDPSIADVIKMVRPKPQDAEQEALYSYIIGRKPINGNLFNATEENLPALVQSYERCKKILSSGKNLPVEIPDVPFQMLDSLGLTDDHWKEIARNARWQMTRMNVNTFQRHGVFQDQALLNLIANRLRDEKEIKRAKAFPYQLMAAYMNSSNAPFEIREALQDAMDIAVSNIPNIPGKIYVFPDTSGSMHSPITGNRGYGRTSTVTCIDVAALIAAAFLRTNRQSKVIPFSTQLDMRIAKQLNPRDSIMTNAQVLKGAYGGGTNVSLGVKYLAEKKLDVDLVIYVSDYESWLDRGYYGNKTATLKYWDEIKKRNPNAKMVCIDLTPYQTAQAPNRDDIMNIGGFSDVVWDVIAQFANHGRDGNHWIEVINQVDITSKNPRNKTDNDIIDQGQIAESDVTSDLQHENVEEKVATLEKAR